MHEVVTHTHKIHTVIHTHLPCRSRWPRNIHYMINAIQSQCHLTFAPLIYTSSSPHTSCTILWKDRLDSSWRNLSSTIYRLATEESCCCIWIYRLATEESWCCILIYRLATEESWCSILIYRLATEESCCSILIYRLATEKSCCSILIYRLATEESWCCILIYRLATEESWSRILDSPSSMVSSVSLDNSTFTVCRPWLVSPCSEPDSTCTRTTSIMWGWGELF